MFEMKKIFYHKIYNSISLIWIFLSIFNFSFQYLRTHSLKESIFGPLILILFAFILFIYGKSHPKLIIDENKIRINRFLKKPIIFKFQDLKYIHKMPNYTCIFTTKDDKEFELNYGFFINNKLYKEFEKYIDTLRNKINN